MCVSYLGRDQGRETAAGDVAHLEELGEMSKIDRANDSRSNHLHQNPDTLTLIRTAGSRTTDDGLERERK